MAAIVHVQSPVAQSGYNLSDPQLEKPLARDLLFRHIQSGEVSIVDTSVIEAKQSRPNTGKGGASTQDPEADWNIKKGSDGKRKTTYGFKAHLTVGEDDLIKTTDYSRGSSHDSNHFTQ